MKKIIIITLSIFVLFGVTACTTPETETSNPIIQEPSIETVEQDPELPEEPLEIILIDNISQHIPMQNPFETGDIPLPFEHTGGTENAEFFEFYSHKLLKRDVIERTFAEYLEIPLEEFLDFIREKYDVASVWDTLSKTNLLKFKNLYSIIIILDIPDEVVIEAFTRWNDFQDEIVEWIREHDESGEISEGEYNYYMSRKFTDAEIAALLSRDMETVLAQFATEHAIVIGEEVFSPFWLYVNPLENFTEVGLTPEMVEEKLELYAEFHFTEEAEAAFEEKLSEFLGREVRLKGGHQGDEDDDDQGSQGGNDDDQGNQGGGQGGRGNQNEQ